MKKIFASIAAVAAASALAMSVSAADWSMTGYADGDPSTVEIISTDANGVTFTQGTPGGSCKARITLIDVLENPEDVSKIKSGSWKITYNGLSSLTGTEIGWLGGGTYAATCNSTGFGLAPDEYDEDGKTVWSDSQTVTDEFKWLLPSQVPSDPAEAEFVFMDWSGQDIKSNGITVTISDLKFFDAAGNEIAQKAYGASAAAVEEAPVEEAAAEEEAAVEETAVEEEAVVEDVVVEEEAVVEEVAAEPVVEEVEVVAEAAPAPAPVADVTTTPVATGNTAVAAIAGVMALAGAAAFVSKRK